MRANTVREGTAIRVYGGNFSRTRSDLRLDIQGQRPWRATLEVMTEQGVRYQKVNAGQMIHLPALSLFRLQTT